MKKIVSMPYTIIRLFHHNNLYDANNSEAKLTFLDLLIKAANNGEANYTNEDIRGEVDTFMAAVC